MARKFDQVPQKQLAHICGDKSYERIEEDNNEIIHTIPLEGYQFANTVESHT